MLAETPFVGRDGVIAILGKKLEAARVGRGSFVMLAIVEASQVTSDVSPAAFFVSTR
jgi:hypothetical protein